MKNLKDKNFFSTKEVADLLDISIATVMRKFDKGIFWGKKNPITHERAISRDSLISFMETYNIPLPPALLGKKRIMLGGILDSDLPIFLKEFPREEGFGLETFTNGADILIHCSQKTPNLLILNQELPDIPSRTVIDSLRRRKECEGLKIICLAEKERFSEVLSWGADEVLEKETFHPEGLKKKICTLLGISEEIPKSITNFAHQRRWPRVNLHVPAEIRACRAKTPVSRGERGKAELVNISPGGAYLSDIQMEKKELPGEPFKILLEVDQPLLQNFRAHCRVMRLQSNGTLAAGVEFIKLSKANRKKIERICLR